MASPDQPLDTDESFLQSHAELSVMFGGTLNTVFMQKELDRKLKRLKKMTDTIERD